MVCAWRRIVASGSGMAILVLTAADRLDEKASGFGLGAGDYLTKPFELQELVLRLRALDRRRAHHRPPVREIAGVRLDPWEALPHLLELDRGDVERAWEEAIEAYRIGLEQNDHILMARARILQAAIENAHVEEQTGEDVDSAVHANRALQYSEEALSLAHGTQNRRLLAGACIARGMTAANDFFQEWETARRYATEATGLIGPSESDHLVEDLTRLKSRVVQASGINDTLRGWSEGIVGNKTFQQITEEFAEIVIPKVWIREDRKVSRVANSLSISPKKVRRILRNSGLVEGQ